MTETPTRPAGFVYPKFTLFTLFLLYVSQGLPYGFQKMALPLLLRDNGMSLTGIGFLGVLGMPWMAKALWAPLLDRYYIPRFGRRKSWILPMQVLLLGTIVIAATLGTASLTALLIAVFFMNLCTATQDIAVDGLAIDTLKPHAMGLGNTAQVVGYKIGMVLAGGILLSLTQAHGWGFLFTCMALLTLLPLLPLAFFKEKPVPKGETVDGRVVDRPSWMEIARKSWHLVTGSELRWGIIFVMTYKVCEGFVESMFTPFLLDAGITREQIGIWLGTYGMAASVTGSVIGGLLITRFRIWHVLGLATALRIIPLGWQWLLTKSAITAGGVIGVTVSEHLAGGILTTAMFAYMMTLVEKRVGATEYTLLASLEVFGKSLSVFASGWVAERIGFGPLFFIGFACAILTLIPWWKCRSIVEC